MSQFRENGQVLPAERQEQRSLMKIGQGLARTGFLLACIVAIYGLAGKIDADNELRNRDIDAKVDAEVVKQREQLWLQRAAQAYARGRADALHDTVEDRDLVMACSTAAGLSGAGK